VKHQDVLEYRYSIAKSGGYKPQDPKLFGNFGSGFINNTDPQFLFFGAAPFPQRTPPQRQAPPGPQPSLQISV